MLDTRQLSSQDRSAFQLCLFLGEDNSFSMGFSNESLWGDSFNFNTPCYSLLWVCSAVILCYLGIYITSGILALVVQTLEHTLLISIQATGTITNYHSNQDRVYHALLRWVEKNCGPLHSQKAYVKTISSKQEKEEEGTNVDNEEDEDEVHEGSKSYKIYPTIGYGVSKFRYKGAWFQVCREILNPRTTISLKTQELLAFKTFFWNRAILEEILNRGKAKNKNKSKSRLMIYRANAKDMYWEQMGGSKKKRPLSTLVLDSGIVKRIVDDIAGFLDMEEWYLDRGIPYRRSYLLYGPPGCGKSSIVKAIAGEINYDICIFSLSSNVTDDALIELFSSAPPNSIILLEDIDAAFKSREGEGVTARETNLAFEGCSRSALTFMGLLNALDGVASADDGQLVFMTTNYPDKLDPALARPGRVDLKISIDYPKANQIEGVFKKFYPQHAGNEKLVKSFSDAIAKINNLKVSVAMLQGLLVTYRNNPKAAIANCEQHFKEQFSNNAIALVNKENYISMYN